MSLSMVLRRCSGSGSGHTSSPADFAASSTRSFRASWLLMSPAVRSPRATKQAPVRVARSMMASGLKRAEYVSASHRIRRPSASVLTTSTVLPLRVRSTSPGRVASGPSMLSVMGM